MTELTGASLMGYVASVLCTLFFSLWEVLKEWGWMALCSSLTIKPAAQTGGGHYWSSKAKCIQRWYYTLVIAFPWKLLVTSKTMGAIIAHVYYAFHKLFSLIKLVKPRKGKANATIIPTCNWGKQCSEKLIPASWMGWWVSEAGFEPSTWGS